MPPALLSRVLQSSGRHSQLSSELVATITAADDFLVFKSVMIARGRELDAAQVYYMAAMVPPPAPPAPAPALHSPPPYYPLVPGPVAPLDAAADAGFLASLAATLEVGASRDAPPVSIGALTGGSSQNQKSQLDEMADTARAQADAAVGWSATPAAACAGVLTGLCWT